MFSGSVPVLVWRYWKNHGEMCGSRPSDRESNSCLRNRSTSYSMVRVTFRVLTVHLTWQNLRNKKCSVWKPNYMSYRLTVASGGTSLRGKFANKTSCLFYLQKICISSGPHVVVHLSTRHLADWVILTGWCVRDRYTKSRTSSLCQAAWSLIWICKGKERRDSVFNKQIHRTSWLSG
jgi:hypothetical protein